VWLEASTKPRVHNLIHEILISMAFTMACPNFKKCLKMVSGPLGVKPSQVQYYTWSFEELKHLELSLFKKLSYYNYYSYLNKI
jgi:hypothetical protein